MLRNAAKKHIDKLLKKLDEIGGKIYEIEQLDDDDYYKAADELIELRRQRDSINDAITLAENMTENQLINELEADK